MSACTPSGHRHDGCSLTDDPTLLRGDSIGELSADGENAHRQAPSYCAPSFTVDRWALITNSVANPWSLRGPCLAPKAAVPVSWDWRDDAAWLPGKEFRKQPSLLWSLLSLLVSSWRVSVAFLGTKTCLGGLDRGVHAITSAFFLSSVLLEKRGWEFQMAV